VDDRNTTALLVIDVQVAMFEPEPAPFRGDELLATIRGLIDRARSAGSDVIYVRHVSDAYAPMNHGAAGWHVHPAIAPEAGDLVIDKKASDAFYETALHTELIARGIERLVMTGLQTELCVDTTCRGALSRDFAVILAADAHSTWDNDRLTAAQVIAHHNATLAGVAHPNRSIVVRPSAEIAFTLEPAAAAS
jgi:nicotinamidase-related amidase